MHASYFHDCFVSGTTYSMFPAITVLLLEKYYLKSSAVQVVSNVDDDIFGLLICFSNCSIQSLSSPLWGGRGVLYFGYYMLQKYLSKLDFYWLI